jgi:hypothetical protein
MCDDIAPPRNLYSEGVTSQELLPPNQLVTVAAKDPTLVSSFFRRFWIVLAIATLTVSF